MVLKVLVLHVCVLLFIFGAVNVKIIAKSATMIITTTQIGRRAQSDRQTVLEIW